MSVSRNAPVDRRKAIKDLRAKPVGIAVISDRNNVTTCSCGGFGTNHRRKKVREDKAQRHLDKKHNGRGMWL